MAWFKSRIDGAKIVPAQSEQPAKTPQARVASASSNALSIPVLLPRSQGLAPLPLAISTAHSADATPPEAPREPVAMQAPKATEQPDGFRRLPIEVLGHVLDFADHGEADPLGNTSRNHLLPVAAATDVPPMKRLLTTEHDVLGRGSKGLRAGKHEVATARADVRKYDTHRALWKTQLEASKARTQAELNSPWTKRTGNDAALVLVQNGQLDDAEAALHISDQLYPGNIQTSRIRAEVCAMKGDLARAIAFGESALRMAKVEKNERLVLQCRVTLARILLAYGTGVSAMAAMAALGGREGPGELHQRARDNCWITYAMIDHRLQNSPDPATVYRIGIAIGDIGKPSIFGLQPAPSRLVELCAQLGDFKLARDALDAVLDHGPDNATWRLVPSPLNKPLHTRTWWPDVQPSMGGATPQEPGSRLTVPREPAKSAIEPPEWEFFSGPDGLEMARQLPDNAAGAE